MSEEQRPEGQSRRQRVTELGDVPGRRFAVFMRTPSGQSAYFRRLAPTEADAIEAARRMAAEVAAKGEPDFTYYAVEIKYRVGIEAGKLVDGPVGD